MNPYVMGCGQNGRLRRILSAAIATLACAAPVAEAETITRAQYDVPIERYGHFALGRPHEYSRLTAASDAGRILTLELPADEVFEDLQPRLVRMTADGPREVLAIVSRRHDGARLVLIGLKGDGLEITAQSPPIGTPMRWLNPVGAADLDGDGQVEIAAVTTPHIGGTLRVYRREKGDLVQIAALAGFSNHVYGSPELRLSAVVLIGGRMQLVVPDASRRHLRIIALEKGRLIETGQCDLRASVTGAIRSISPLEISVGLSSGEQVVALNDCPRKPEG